ncbi:hypothetical protein RCO28_38000 [Streptomyces sp. LHD-70]|uniref:hypothetical protein n=1 Tax=Streptomyces sp. LHD-70 TaxID=3072140 RepID=UPI00280D1252|nr:hypothetical protein [Streptomyces sp. LHD-70]MDQ8708212.1 hypothetical protein [Streptomyces sp. LHD-70]
MTTPAEVVERHECLQPTMGTGPDHEIRFRIHPVKPPVIPPARRGIYLDVNRGLWADPASAAFAETADADAGAATVTSRATLPLDALAIDVVNPSSIAMPVLGMFTVHLRGTYPRGAAGSLTLDLVAANDAAPEEGQTQAFVSADIEQVALSNGYSFWTSVPAFSTRTVFARAWIMNMALQSFQMAGCHRRLTLCGASQGGEVDG